MNNQISSLDTHLLVSALAVFVLFVFVFYLYACMRIRKFPIVNKTKLAYSNNYPK